MAEDPTNEHGNWWTRRWSEPVSPQRKWLGIIVVGVAAFIIARYDFFGLYPDDDSDGLRHSSVVIGTGPLG